MHLFRSRFSYHPKAVQMSSFTVSLTAPVPPKISHQTTLGPRVVNSASVGAGSTAARVSKTIVPESAEEDTTAR